MRLRHVVVASIAVIVSTLSLSEAQRVWNRDTLSFHPQRYIKETGAVFEQLKIDHTDAVAPFEIYLEGGVWQIRSGGGRIRDLPTPTGAGQATNKGYVDGIRNTLQNADNDARPNTFEFPEHSNNPNTNSVSRAYWNTTVDSLRIRTSTGWRNIGQRGAGYYELRTHGGGNDNPLRINFSTQSDGERVFIEAGNGRPFLGTYSEDVSVNRLQLAANTICYFMGDTADGRFGYIYDAHDWETMGNYRPNQPVAGGRIGWIRIDVSFGAESVTPYRPLINGSSVRGTDGSSYVLAIFTSVTCYRPVGQGF